MAGHEVRALRRSFESRSVIDLPSEPEWIEGLSSNGGTNGGF